jgi:hypothetical protein
MYMLSVSKYIRDLHNNCCCFHVHFIPEKIKQMKQWGKRVKQVGMHNNTYEVYAALNRLTTLFVLATNASF